jgi:trehalose 6-phosphate phosphatase
MKNRRIRRNSAFDTSTLDAAIFDMDGVVTSTERVHAAAWKMMFDEYLRERAERGKRRQKPFDIVGDYHRYVDGKPRYDGAAGFLQSRGISLPYGDPGDPPERETVCGLGNRKNRYFLERLKELGASPYPSTVAFVHRLKERKMRTAVISASRNARVVLESAELTDLFDVVVDGVEAARLGLEGKPSPDIFLEAAKRLAVKPQRAAVIEDALAGVKAARSGGFALVVGIDRGEQRNELREWGADVVVADLSELRIYDADGTALATELPSALGNKGRIFARLREGTPAVFFG